MVCVSAKRTPARAFLADFDFDGAILKPDHKRG